MEVILIKALQLILAFSILVVVHEFGHFMFARIFKVRVEKFYLFFNPWFSLFKFKPKNSETEYGVGWLPLGGYVKIAGMIDESMDTEQMKAPAQDWEFRAKPAYARLLIMVGGVLFNFLLAMGIYAGIAFHWGDQTLPLRNMSAGMEFSQVAKEAGFQDGDIILRMDGVESEELDLQRLARSKEVIVRREGREVRLEMPTNLMQQVIAANTRFASIRIPIVVKGVTEGSLAATAGLLPADSITAINQIALFESNRSEELEKYKGSDVEFTVYRMGQPLIVPVSINEEGKIGIQLKNPTDIFSIETKSYSVFEAVPIGINRGVSRLTGYVSSLKYIFTKEGAQSVGGFVAIGNIFPSVWNWRAFWELTAFLSIMLGFMNILPIPALDGGHVLFLLYEVVARRKPNEKFMEYAQLTGMALLFGLLIFANGNDLFKIFFK